MFARGWDANAHRRPFVVSSGGHRPLVVVANDRARDAGIRDGQAISAALALAPELAMRNRDPAAESAALARIATTALAFTPMVSLVPSDAIVADIGASLRLFGGLERLVDDLHRQVRACGFDARVGLAATPVASLALARAARPDPVATGMLRDALAPLALSHFDLDSDVRATLAAAGVSRFGELAALPRDGLARRFGAPVVSMIDRALGRIPDPRLPYVPPPRFEAKLELPAPVHDVEALGFAVNRLVRELHGWLLGRGLGVVRLALKLHHEPALMRGHETRATEAPFALGAPARDPAHLLAVLRERLGRLALPAPVEAIVLATLETATLAGSTHGLLPGSEADAPLVPLADRLRARLGDETVTRIGAQAEHRPERAMHDRPIQLPPAKTAPLPPAMRPLWLLAEPQPLRGVLEAKPWALRDGPERIESGWWDGGDARRDYFVAETDEGEIVWIFRDHRRGTEDGEWFLHGIFG